MAKRILIVGGVAGGASCATRLRRLDEHAEIVVFERGPYVSFANCGLPYFVGDVIKEESKLLVATPELFRERFAIDVRPQHEVTSIDRDKQCIEVRRRADGATFVERYDNLVIATGARPLRPPIEGIDLPGIFAVRTVPDARHVRDWIERHEAKRAVVVGGGFIGCEMVENLVGRGLSVEVIELADQLLPPFDPEIVGVARQRMQERGVEVRIGDSVCAFSAVGERLLVETTSGASIETDLVILSIGVVPESGLAKESGLAIGPRGHIRVDPAMRTSDPKIFAVGDAVLTEDAVTGESASVPLAGPANRQGRIAAGVICGRAARFRGVQGTAVCALFDLTLALTGETEKSLKRAGIEEWDAVYLHPGHHVGYFPGARPMHLKLIYRRGDGRILGAQGSGEAGVERRIDVIASFIQMRATVFDLEEAELCYAPQFGAAKDPVNMAGMIAANELRGDVVLARWDETSKEDVFLLDVRDPHEIETPLVARMQNIPLAQLRTRIDEIPRDRPVLVTCAVGQRAYNATRILRQRGIDARLLSGGAKTKLEIDAATTA